MSAKKAKLRPKRRPPKRASFRDRIIEKGKGNHASE